MHKQRNVQNCLAQSKWSLRKAVLLLAEDPAQGAFENSQNSLLPATVGSASGAGASDSESSLFYRGQASIIFSEHSSGFPSRSCDPERQPHPGDFEFCFG